MAIQFEFYKNPQPEKEGEEPSYHPRVVNFQHVTTQKLAREIHMATTFRKSGSRSHANGIEQMHGQPPMRRRTSTSGWDRLFPDYIASDRTRALAYHPCR